MKIAIGWAAIWLFISGLGTSAHSSSRQIVVRWENDWIKLSDLHSDVRLWRPVRPTSKSKVDCVFLVAKTDCIRISRKRKGGDPYGIDMRFVTPIAVLPNKPNESTEDPDKEAVDERGTNT